MADSVNMRQLAGVVVYVQQTQCYLVLERVPTWYVGWGLIQGGIELNESAAQAAIREMREEIGVALDTQRLDVSHLIDLQYYYVYFNQHTKRNSCVHWFAINFAQEPHVTLQADEWLACQWLPYDQALVTLVWAEQQEALRRAHGMFGAKQ